MKLRFKLVLFLGLLSIECYCQKDSLTVSKSSDIFQRITNELKAFKLDTSAVPDDKTTRTILELRTLRGGFNINEAIEFKIEEDRQKGEMTAEELDQLSEFFKHGAGREKLDNAIIWIYRQHFTRSELKQLVKFYKTSAGAKWSAEFPVIMLKSLAAAERIKELEQTRRVGQ
ncbi:MAG: DUF2059 domain-containing protein [Bacteroidota bacterium]|nr:DUF2059 domain-containing protein [Bacteroidota bacterium]